MSYDIRFLERDAFLADFGVLYAELIRGWSREASPFRNETWEQVLIPGEAARFDRRTFEAVGKAMASAGDELVIVTISGAIPPHEVSVAIPWDRETVGRAHRGSYIHIFDYAIFGLSGAWAAMSYHDELTRVAGKPQFMDAFAGALGGREAVKRRFFEFQAQRWDAPKDVQERILASVGWGAKSQN